MMLGPMRAVSLALLVWTGVTSSVPSREAHKFGVDVFYNNTRKNELIAALDENSISYEGSYLAIS